jgi:hypothetical protein
MWDLFDSLQFYICITITFENTVYFKQLVDHWHWGTQRNKKSIWKILLLLLLTAIGFLPGGSVQYIFWNCRSYLSKSAFHDPIPLVVWHEFTVPLYNIFTYIYITVLIARLNFSVFLVICHLFMFSLVFPFDSAIELRDTNTLCYYGLFSCADAVIYWPLVVRKILWSVSCQYCRIWDVPTCVIYFH